MNFFLEKCVSLVKYFVGKCCCEGNVTKKIVVFSFSDKFVKLKVYYYTIRCILQERSLKERTLLWRTLKLLFILFNNLNIYRCTSEVMELQLKYFVFFPCTWKMKLLNTSKTEAFLAISNNISYIPRHRTRGSRWLWWRRI